MCRSTDACTALAAPCQEVQGEPKNLQKQVELQFLENVLANPEVTPSENLQKLMGEAQDLSNKIFAKDCLEMIAEDNRYRLTLLVQHEIPEDDVIDEVALQFLGFVVYKIREDKQCLTISRLAVIPECRGQGLGTKLIEWCQKQNGVSYIALASLPTALKFYRKLGFKKVATWSEGGQARPDMIIAEGHTYMELRALKKGKAKGRSRKAH